MLPDPATSRKPGLSKALVIAPLFAAMLLLGLDQAAFGQSAWCLDEPGAGVTNCGFHTFAQCQASRPGGSTSCSPNPALPGTVSSADRSRAAGRERRR